MDTFRISKNTQVTSLSINKPIPGCVRMPCNSLLTTSLLQDARFDYRRGQAYFSVSEYCNTVVDLPGGAGVCSPPLNLPRGGAEGMQGEGANFFQVLNFICGETLSGHGMQVIEQVLGHLFHSPKLIFYCF